VEHLEFIQQETKLGEEVFTVFHLGKINYEKQLEYIIKQNSGVPKGFYSNCETLFNKLEAIKIVTATQSISEQGKTEPTEPEISQFIQKCSSNSEQILRAAYYVIRNNSKIEFITFGDFVSQMIFYSVGKCKNFYLIPDIVFEDIWNQFGSLLQNEKLKTKEALKTAFGALLAQKRSRSKKVDLEKLQKPSNFFSCYKGQNFHQISPKKIQEMEPPTKRIKKEEDEWGKEQKIVTETPVIELQFDDEISPSEQILIDPSLHHKFKKFLKSTESSSLDDTL